MRTIADQLERAREVFNAIEANQAIRDRLASHGYDAAALSTGRVLFDDATTARIRSHSAQARLLAAGKEVSRLRGRAEANYTNLAQITRCLFEGDIDVLTALALRPAPLSKAAAAEESEDDAAPVVRRRRRSNSQAAFLDRARILYTNAQANSEVMAALHSVGYTEARLHVERTGFEALEAACTELVGARSAAKSRTAAQHASLEALRRWMNRFSTVLQVMMADEPAMLDTLGIQPGRLVAGDEITTLTS